MKKTLFPFVITIIFIGLSVKPSFTQKLDKIYKDVSSKLKNGISTKSIFGSKSLFTEDFSGSDFPPEGWYVEGDGQANWTKGTSNNAGGEAPELKFNYSPAFQGFSRFVTPTIETSDAELLLLSLKHYLHDYGTAPSYMLRVETTSNGGNNWEEVWSLEDPGTNIGPEELFIIIDNDDVGSEEFQLAFSFEGDSYQINWWYIDDITLTQAYYFDVEANEIFVPELAVNSDVVVPGGVVANFGLEYANFSAEFIISDNDGGGIVYSEILEDIELDVFSSDTVHFPDWICSTGSFTAELIVNMPGDENEENNFVQSTINVFESPIYLKPLYEAFTSSSSEACVIPNQQMDELFSQNPETHSLIKYPMNTPQQGDPYYTSECGDRYNFYNDPLIPRIFINANELNPILNPLSQAIYDSYLTDLTGIEIEISQAEIDNDNNVNIQVDVSALIDYETGLTLQVAVVEKTTVNNVGGNGEAHFSRILMKMLPDANGTTLPALSPDNVETIIQSFDMDNTNMEEPDDLELVVFIQDDENKKVLQSANANIEGDFTTYNVGFHFVDEELNPIEGVEVAMEGNGVQISNITGFAIFQGVFPGVYNYEIYKQGYFPESGEVTVIDQDVTVDMQLVVPCYDEYFNTGIPENWTIHVTNPDLLNINNQAVIFWRQSDIINPIMLVSHQINISNAEMIYFDAGNQYGNPTLSFGVVTDPNDPETFSELSTYQPNEEWETFSFDLTQISSTQPNVFFAWQLSTTEFSVFEFDNVLIDGEPPVLDPPTNLTVSLYNDNNAHLTWEAPLSESQSNILFMQEISPEKPGKIKTKELLGYNIYRNGEFHVYTEELEYDDTDLEYTTYEYYVTAVYNEGESAPSNYVTITPLEPVADFFDDFENGLANWEVTGAWGITDEYSYSSGNSLTDSPGGDYLPNQETYATMVNGVDFSDPTILSATVSWWMIMDIENGNFDYLYVEVSDDNFSTFTQIASFFGEDMLDPWIEYSYPLGAFLGSNNVKVRFHFSSDGGYEVDGSYIDDFSILTSDVDNAAPEIFFDKPFGYEGTIGDYIVEAEIIDATGIASAEVLYTVDGITQANIVGVNTSGNNWEFTIPQEEPGYQINFVINAIDSSPSANEAVTDTASYIAGNYIGYDNAQVDFFTEVGPDGTSGNVGVAVAFTIDDPSQLVTALIRNYVDQSVGLNNEMVVHVWSDGGNQPGEDLIDPITILPEADLVNTIAFTRIDLRPYTDQLSNLSGDFFIGFTVPEGVVRTTITQPGITERSFSSPDGNTWTLLTDDFHFRIITSNGNLIPPPTDLTTEPIDEDIVLNWNAPESSSDQTKDLLGYNVYYGFNSATPDFIEYITSITYIHEGVGIILGLHTYYVTAVYDEGESVPSNEEQVSIVAIGEHGFNDLQVYPNPTYDLVTIKSEKDIKKIEIFDYSGKIVFKEVYNEKLIEVDVSQFKPGIYFLKVKELDKNDRKVKLIIK